MYKLIIETEEDDLKNGIDITLLTIEAMKVDNISSINYSLLIELLKGKIIDKSMRYMILEAEKAGFIKRGQIVKIDDNRKSSLMLITDKGCNRLEEIKNKKKEGR